MDGQLEKIEILTSDLEGKLFEMSNKLAGALDNNHPVLDFIEELKELMERFNDDMYFARLDCLRKWEDLHRQIR